MALSPPRHAFARHGEFVPTEGGKLNVSLPGELVGSLVLQLYGRDVAVVELAVYYTSQGQKKKGALLGKSHTYQAGDIVTVQRGLDDFGIEVWQPVERRHDLDEAHRIAEGLAQQSEPQPEPAEDSASAAPEIGSGPAAEPDAQEFKKVLGPRRSKVKRSPPETERKRVLGPRRSKIAHPQGVTP